MITLIVVSAIVGIVCLIGGGYLGYRYGASAKADIDQLILEIEKLGGSQ
jgi:hypothetical protein